MALAAALIHDAELTASPEIVPLVEAFAVNHAGAAMLEAAWDTISPGNSSEEWLAVMSRDEAFKRAATDLALTALFGAVFVDRKPIDTRPNQPEWAFVGRFWRLVDAHAPALSMGPFGHWAYPPGPRAQ